MSLSSSSQAPSSIYNNSKMLQYRQLTFLLLLFFLMTRSPLEHLGVFIGLKQKPNFETLFPGHTQLQTMPLHSPSHWLCGNPE